MHFGASVHLENAISLSFLYEDVQFRLITLKQKYFGVFVKVVALSKFNSISKNEAEKKRN